MKFKTLSALMSALLLFASGASARDLFDTGSLRGRYTGHLVLGATFSDGTTTQRLDAQLLPALTFDGKGQITGGSIITVTIPGPNQPPFTCPFAVTGSYQLGVDGLGNATILFAPLAAATCGDGGGGVTLQVSLVIGGHNRHRLDITVNGAIDSEGQPLPIVGAGTLEK